MKVLHMPDVLERILEILKDFEKQRSEGVFRQIADIRDVAFGDMPMLFKILYSKYGECVRFHMNGELETEGMLILYTPSIGMTIGIESEPCVDLRWRIREGITLVNIN